MKPLPIASRLSVLMYHQIGEFPPPPVHRASFLHVSRFRSQMLWLRRLGFNVISLSRCYQGLFLGEPLPPRSVVLTFDDGCRNFREFAFPILRELKFPATVFVLPGLLGGATTWIDDMPPEWTQPLLSADEVRQLHRKGVHFGSHTLTHAHLTRLTPAQMRTEISDSKARLEDLLDCPCEDFCYPYGDYDARAVELVAEAGYRSAVTCVRAAANAAPSSLEIPRKAVSYGDSALGLWLKLLTKNKPSQR